MTIETRATVELKDLAAVEYQCNCGAKSVRPIGGGLRERGNTVPVKCEACGELWTVDGSVARHIAQLLNLVAVLADQKGARFTLRFEVAGLPDARK